MKSDKTLEETLTADELELYQFLQSITKNKDAILPIMIAVVTSHCASDILGFIEEYDVTDIGIIQKYIFEPDSLFTLADMVDQDSPRKPSSAFSPFYIRELFIDGSIPYDEYFAQLPVVKALWRQNGLEFTNSITMFVGENGTGKSTITEGIAVAAGFNPEGGTLNYQFSTADTHSGFHEYIKLIRGTRRNTDGFFLRAESFYNAASYLDEIDKDDPLYSAYSTYGGISLHEQSHGESFMALAENKFNPSGLYILDEPEAALSPMKQLRLLVRIHNLAEEGAQFIIATHSPILMTLPGADIIQINQEGIAHVQYQDTEHFQIASDFLRYPERMLKEMLR